MLMAPPPLEAAVTGGFVRAAISAQRRYEARRLDRERRREERVRHRSSLALGAAERQAVLDAVHEPRFVDRSVPHIYATLLDQAPITARCRRCTASCTVSAKRASGGIMQRGLRTSNPNSALRSRARCSHGTLASCTARESRPTTTGRNLSSGLTPEGVKT